MQTLKEHGKGCYITVFFYLWRFSTMNRNKLLLYAVDDDYVDALTKIDSKIAHNKAASRTQTRKYIGVLFEINGLKYFANLSSYKPWKHDKMNESVDFIKIGTYAVINLNNMMPVIDGKYHIVDLSCIIDAKYKILLEKEARIIKAKSAQIIKNANIVYNHKIINGNETPLARRCCDFKKLESYAVQAQEHYNSEIAPYKI